MMQRATISSGFATNLPVAPLHQGRWSDLAIGPRLALARSRSRFHEGPGQSTG